MPCTHYHKFIPNPNWLNSKWSILTNWKLKVVFISFMWKIRPKIPQMKIVLLMPTFKLVYEKWIAIKWKTNYLSLVQKFNQFFLVSQGLYIFSISIVCWKWLLNITCGRNTPSHHSPCYLQYPTLIYNLGSSSKLERHQKNYKRIISTCHPKNVDT